MEADQVWNEPGDKCQPITTDEKNIEEHIVKKVDLQSAVKKMLSDAQRKKKGVAEQSSEVTNDVISRYTGLLTRMAQKVAKLNGKIEAFMAARG